MEGEASARISSSSAGSTLFFSSRDLAAGAGVTRTDADDDDESFIDLNVGAIGCSSPVPDHHADGGADASPFQFQLPPADHLVAASPASPAVADELFRGGRLVPLGDLLRLGSAGADRQGGEPRMAQRTTTPAKPSGMPPRASVSDDRDGAPAAAPEGNDARDVNAPSGWRRRPTGTPDAARETPTTQQSSRVRTSKKPPRPRRSGGSGGSSASILKLLIKYPSESIRSVYLYFVRPAAASPARSAPSSPRPQEPRKPQPFHGLLAPIYHLLAPNGARKVHNKERQRVVFELGGGSAGDVLEAMRLSNASSSGRWRDGRSPVHGGSRRGSRPGSPLSSPQHRGAWGAANREREAERERKRAFERESSIGSAIAYCKGASK